VLGWVNPQVLPSPVAVVESALALPPAAEAYDPEAGSFG
jgi:hypothetical protein